MDTQMNNVEPRAPSLVRQKEERFVIEGTTAPEDCKPNAPLVTTAMTTD